MFAWTGREPDLCDDPRVGPGVAVRHLALSTGFLHTQQTQRRVQDELSCDAALHATATYDRHHVSETVGP